MSNLENALARTEAALDRLETAIGTNLTTSVSDEVAVELPLLRAERDELVGEVEELRARADEDLKLRAEAAGAVRDALRNLRGAVKQGASSHA